MNTTTPARFTKASCRALMGDIIEELQTLAAARGLTIEAAGGTFSSGEVTMKVKVSAKDADGVPVSFSNHATMLGLPADCYGAVFLSNGSRFRVSGIKLRNRKYPVLAIKIDTGDTYKFPVAIVRQSVTVQGGGQ